MHVYRMLIRNVPDSRDSQNILLRGIMRDSVISCKRERGIGSRGNELLVALSVPIYDMEGTENILSDWVGMVGLLKWYFVGDCWEYL